jgi:anti-anti-sigma factor
MTFTPRNYRLISFPSEYSPDSVYKFTEDLRDLAQSSADPILVDCQKIKMIYSGGLGILINGYKFCNERKIYFGIVNVNDTVRNVIRSTNLHKILNLFPTILEFEVLEMDAAGIGTKVPPLEFSFEVKTSGHVHVYTCKGIMFDGNVFQNLKKSLATATTAIFDLTNLSFLESDCIPIFESFLVKNKLVIVGMNTIIEDEFRLFDLLEKIQIQPSLQDAYRECGL